MKITKTITKEQLVIDDILCNKCGESLKVDENYFCGLAEAIVFGEYLSPIFEDGSERTFSLCENCLQDLFETFKIPTETNLD